MRILVCGSRDFDDTHLVWAMLDDQFSWIEGSGDPFIVIEGAAKGADACAAGWVAYKDEHWPEHGISHHSFPADWEQYGKRGGVIRNQRMLDEGQPDLVLAFVNRPLEESHGTADMVRRARAAGVKTIVVDSR